MSSKSGLASKLAELANPTPVVIDEEELYPETEAQVVEWDEDLHVDADTVNNRSYFRSQNASLLEENDTKYAGRKISRKKLAKLQGDWDIDNIQETVEDKGPSSSVSEEDEDESKNNENSDNAEEPGEEEEEESDGNSDGDVEAESDEKQDEDNGGNEEQLSYFTRSEADTYLEKAKATRSQLGLWENLLEARINLQRVLSVANKLPQFDTFPKFQKSGNEELSSVCQSSQSSIKELLDKLVELKDVCLKQNPETKDLRNDGSKRKESPTKDADDEEITSESETEEIAEPTSQTDEPIKKKMKLDEYEKHISKEHTDFTTYRDATIQKWNTRTRILSGKFTLKDFNAFDQSTLKQIQQILSDQSRLVKRTQLKRSEYHVLGKVEERKQPSDEDYTQTHDREIFDDDDFYHHLLREFIDRKASDSTDPHQLGKKLLELQKLRSKMKRRRENKSSKGRKLKYDIHPKLVNFMASMFPSEMSDSARTELFNSVFGGASASIMKP